MKAVSVKFAGLSLLRDSSWLPWKTHWFLEPKLETINQIFVSSALGYEIFRFLTLAYPEGFPAVFQPFISFVNNFSWNYSSWKIQKAVRFCQPQPCLELFVVSTLQLWFPLPEILINYARFLRESLGLSFTKHSFTLPFPHCNRES